MSLLCEFCRTNAAEVEGWFYTSARLNPFAKGTASAGLMQFRIACKKCAEKAIESGMTPAKSVEEDNGE